MSGAARRVMVTGIGLLTALGEGVQPTWQGLIDGRSAIGPLRAYDPSPLSTRIGAEITGFDPARFLSRRSLRMVNRGDQLAVSAATLAIQDAGLDPGAELGHRVGLFLGGNKEMPRLDDVISNLATVRGPDARVDMPRLGRTAGSVIPPLFYVEGLQSAAVYHVSEKFGIRGPNVFFAGTADTGAAAIGRGMRTIRRGDADLVLAGGYDDATSWWSMSKIDALGVLSTRNELGDRACRPYDIEHSGSVFGEGAAILVLEERDRALGRGAHCYAEVTGFGAGNDCVRPPAPEPRARGLAHAITRALADAGHSAEIDYIASHGCATPKGDLSEVRALHDALGSAAKRAQVSSVKPQTGHLVGGAGALNAAVAALALDTGVVPATRNLETPAAECDLDFVPGAARNARPASALALARGLAGQAVAVALEKMA
jgi:3-oxoacyl-[acyl-carrier-protein] synthase II